MKFNPKVYQDKKRLYRPVPGTVGIQRLLTWDDEKKEYRSPERGKIYEVRRYEPTLAGGKKRLTRYFETLEEARDWQSHLTQKVQPVYQLANTSLTTAINNEQNCLGPLFSEVVEDFRRRCYPVRAIGTRVHYDQLLALHFSKLMPVPINAITAKSLDHWIWGLRESVLKSNNSRSRISFDKELTLLGAILRFYDKYNDDPNFRFPIKQRHRDDSKFRRDIGKKDRDLPPEDFLKVRDAVLQLYGPMWATMFTAQWRQALRVSEVAGIYWEDIIMNFVQPNNSSLNIKRHIEWARKKGMISCVTMGFKNSITAGRVKEQPMFPETFAALKQLFSIGAKGLVFKNRDGSLLEYRQIQHRYGKAFAEAGVEFTGTHSLRHGGCRALYNETGDIALAGMLLGNEDADSIKVYARRDKSALKKNSDKHWLEQNFFSLAANGRNSDHP